MARENTIMNQLDELIKELPKKQFDVVTSRFGILGKKKKTLANIGKKYGITRERVRQIEVASLKILKEKAKNIDEIASAYKKLLSHIKNAGGVRRVDMLEYDAAALFGKNVISPEYITLLFKMFEKPFLSKETKNFYAFWYIDNSSLNSAKKFISKLYSEFKKNKKAILDNREFDKVIKKVIKEFKFTEAVAMNVLNVSKKFIVSVFGDFGLSDWPEIMPKTVRDKSYVVLKKMKKPMHFREIAGHITKAKFDNKKAHPQTVHNELIKDERFVLVGKGLYSLREFGIEPGTTREVIQKILKKKGPLHQHQIMELVSQQRSVRKNTILINLHNKKHFKKLKDGRYHIA